MRNSRYGEIWWFFPFGDATECTHAIIYNIRENCWYDTRYARSAGYSARVFRYPVTFNNVANPNTGDYSNYVDEFGLDAIEGGSQLAIPAYFETADFGFPTGGAGGEQPIGSDFWTRLIRIEPDFVQSGPMSVIIKGREFANSPVTESTPQSFEPETEYVDMREQQRQIQLRFESNVIGGDFHMGRTIIHSEPGDARS
jgi:hypothetical protein